MPSASHCQTSTAAFQIGAHDAQASRRTARRDRDERLRRRHMQEWQGRRAKAAPYICSCMNLRDGSPRLNDQEASLSAAAAVTRRRWTCILTTDERGSVSSTISSLERHVRCGGLQAVVRVEAANGRRSRSEWLSRWPRVRGRPCPRCRLAATVCRRRCPP